MKTLLALLCLLSIAPLMTAADTVVYQGKSGIGAGKHVVLLAGDEEYRSEEAMPMLAKILADRLGFKCTVLFSIEDGVISPTNTASLSGSEALESADAIVMSLRFRNWPEDAMKRFADAYQRGVPFVALRTSTHAFNFKGKNAYGKFGWSNKEWPGGFGKQVLGETWVSHWGNHKKEATRGIIEPSAKDDPILRGVSDIFGTTDVYEAVPPADAKILVRGQVLKGMEPGDAPADYKKKRADKQEQPVNDPMMPVAWSREYKNESGKVNRVLCTTMGASSDLPNEGLRRLVVNGVLWGLKLEVPAKTDVSIPGGEFHPTMYGFNGHQKGTKPSDYTMEAPIPPKKSSP
jgi:hypothetical protein